MPASLPPHSHCWNCENPVGEGEPFCSEECRNDFYETRKKKNRKMMIFYLIAVAAIVVIGILSSL
ncbi:MAG: DUF2116 family Zn-ribbon domain-containing protein [Methanomassiliicoccales archaeon]